MLLMRHASEGDRDMTARIASVSAASLLSILPSVVALTMPSLAAPRVELVAHDAVRSTPATLRRLWSALSARPAHIRVALTPFVGFMSSTSH
jgi:hypothetical protein